jgi:hypothetical protein
MPIFDSACYVAGSEFHIPAFGSRRNPTPTTSGSQAANEAVKKRKAELKKLADRDDVIKYDKFHAANLIAKPNPTATSLPLPPSSDDPPPHDYVQDTARHVTSAPDSAKHERATSQTHNGGTERGQKEHQ